jgi:hypothetical protein
VGYQRVVRQANWDPAFADPAPGAWAPKQVAKRKKNSHDPALAPFH